MAKYRVKIDKQGRIVIPSEIRKRFGLKNQSELLISVKEGYIILEPVDEDIERSVEEWFKKMVELKIEARGFELAGGKWMSDEYVKRKLGID